MRPAGGGILANEAVTTLERTPLQVTSISLSDRYLMRELERSSHTTPGSPRSPRPASPSSAAGRLAVALADALVRQPVAGIRGAGPRRRPARLRRRAAVRARRRDRRRGRRRSAPGPLVGHCSGATGSRRWRPHEAFSLHPLMSVPAGSGGVASARCRGRDRRHDPARASPTPRRSPARWGCSPFALADDGPRRLPRRRLGGLQLPASRSRPPPSGSAPGPGLTREQLVPLVRATVENWAAARRRARPHRAGRPRRRGDGGRAARGGRRARAGAARAVRRAGRRRRSAGRVPRRCAA